MFRNHLNRYLGVRKIPISYVTRPDVGVEGGVPPNEAGHTYSTEHDPLEGDLIFRASHTHGIYCNHHVTVYHNMEEATRGKPYADSIKTFQIKNNGRGALTAMESQYVGPEKWDAEIKEMDALLHTQKWKGRSIFPLKKFVQQHRNDYVSMQACTAHLQY